MARRAAPVTKGRTPPKKPKGLDAATPAPARRSAKSKPQDDPSMDLLMPDSAPIDAGHDVHEPEAPPAAKARRGRKPKADAMATELEGPVDAVPPAESPEPEPSEAGPSEPELPPVAKAPKPPSPPRKTRRNREPEASAPPPLDIADEPPAETHDAAAHWHAETGTVTFDWPAIEQVAAAEGPNQPMAKLLLAARTEGATSRWPF